MLYGRAEISRDPRVISVVGEMMVVGAASLPASFASGFWPASAPIERGSWVTHEIPGSRASANATSSKDMSATVCCSPASRGAWILRMVMRFCAVKFGSKVVVLDEPTAALGVRESGQVLDLVRRLGDAGTPVILISHNMPQVFDVADRIHVERLGCSAATITPKSHSRTEAVAIMTAALEV